MEGESDKERTVQSRPKLPRLYHKKSRTGCQRCRARRVKCDEIRPICRGCSRHSVACVYDKEPEVHSKSSSKEKSKPSSASQSSEWRNHISDSTKTPFTNPLTQDDTEYDAISSAELKDADIFDIPESRTRRILELRLLQNYISNTAGTFPATHNPELKHSWAVEAPNIALKHDNLLYGILSISALNLLRTGTHTAEIAEAQKIYRSLSLREQRRAVIQLSSANADSVCFASALMLIDAFGTLHDRNLEPYSPPMDWLQMSRGARAVFEAAGNTIEDYETTKIMVVMKAEPFLYDLDSLFSENREDFKELLMQDIVGAHEVWDEDTRVAYEQTLSYMGSIKMSIKNGEHIMAVRRRLMAFALLVPQRFVKFLQAGQPRALVVLAHYFGLTAQLNPIWWIGKTPHREIDAIQKVLPNEWQRLMRWPLEAVREGPLNGLS